MASKIPLDVLGRNKRFKEVERMQRRAEKQLQETTTAMEQYPEIATHPKFRKTLLCLRNQFESCDSAVRGYMRDESRFQRFGALEVKVEAVEELLCTCEADVRALLDDVVQLHVMFVDMADGFNRRIKLMHTKVKRLRAGFLNVARRRTMAAKAGLREKPPQLGSLPEVQDALQCCEACVTSMTTILEHSKVDLLSEENFGRQMRGIIESLDEQQVNLDAAERDLRAAIDRGMGIIGGLSAAVTRGGGASTAPRPSPSSGGKPSFGGLAAQATALAEAKPASPWVQRDDGQGNAYFENTRSGATQWERPPDFAPPAAAAAPVGSAWSAAARAAQSSSASPAFSKAPSSSSSPPSSSVDVLCAGQQLREDDGLANVLMEAQRAAHFGKKAMQQVIEVDNLVLGDNTVVKVNDVQKQRAFHFLATGQILGPRKLNIDAMHAARAARDRELARRLGAVQYLAIGELKGELEKRRCRATGQRPMLEQRLQESMRREWEKAEKATRAKEDKDIEENGDLVSSGRGDAEGGAVPVHFEDEYERFAKENPHLYRRSNDSRTDPFYRAAQARLRKVLSTGDMVRPRPGQQPAAPARTAVGTLQARSSSASSLKASGASIIAATGGAATPKSKGCAIQ